LGIREGVCHLVKPFWAHSFGGHLSSLLRSQESWEKPLVSFSGVAGRVLLTLFQQSYKGFKGKFFRVYCNAHDPTLLDGFPLYWVGMLKLKKHRTLEELIPSDRELCQVLASLGVVFNIAQLIKHEFISSGLKGYIGTSFDSFSISLCISVISLSCLCILWFYPLYTVTLVGSFLIFFLVQEWCSMRRKVTDWLR